MKCWLLARSFPFQVGLSHLSQLKECMEPGECDSREKGVIVLTSVIAVKKALHISRCECMLAIEWYVASHLHHAAKHPCNDGMELYLLFVFENVIPEFCRCLRGCFWGQFNVPLMEFTECKIRLQMGVACQSGGWVNRMAECNCSLMNKPF